VTTGFHTDGGNHFLY